MITQEQIDALPVIGFDELEREYAGRGVQLRDLMGSSGHFRAWRRRRGLPRTDPEGKDEGSSRIYMQMYREDPEGEDACPPYVDLWHWLLKAYEPMPWGATPGYRHKTVPLAKGVFQSVPEVTEEEIADARRRLEAHAGQPLSDEMWKPTADHLRQGPIRSAKSIGMIDEIVTERGVDVGSEYGPMVLLRMQVSC